MTAYYNENAPEAAEWLRELIRAGEIAPGHVDERSIADVRPIDLHGFTQCHFFAGIGGWSLALRSAGWPDHRPVWTGSCPCQPFSLAGKQRGFDDERHLWPFFRYLIAQRRPSVVFGEQVASASQWLGLVRGDLEALEYAVGAMPIEAASAGADHLRDRFWFVGHDPSQRWGEGWPEHEIWERGGPTVAEPSSGRLPNACSGRLGRSSERESEQPGRAEVIGASDSSNLADDDDARPQGRPLLPERAGERIAGPDGVADAYKPRTRQERKQRGGEFSRIGSNPETCNSGHLGEPESERGDGSESAARPNGRHGPENTGYEWVIGADGKARRVKPGIRLLAHGIPGRVGLLRGFGNAIDPRPAAAFIKAAQESIDGG